jgi:glycosyltransferase involved in cell wall biosynthesis
VTIKDIKTFIRSVKILSNEIQYFKAIVAGPIDEDPEYYNECLSLTNELGISDILNFPGRLNMKEFLPTIHINVLTSISEAQPLVILEAGASGIPTVATNVGSCAELIYGREDENPKLGQGGLIVPVSDPQAMSNAIAKLLKDENLYQSMSKVIKKRVHTYYTMEMQNKTYQDLYNEFLK